MLSDILGIVGAASITVGAGLIYTPAGFIVLGVLCIAAAARAARTTR